MPGSNHVKVARTKRGIKIVFISDDTDRVNKIQYYRDGTYPAPPENWQSLINDGPPTEEVLRWLVDLNKCKTFRTIKK